MRGKCCLRGCKGSPGEEQDNGMRRYLRFLTVEPPVLLATQFWLIRWKGKLAGSPGKEFFL